RNSIRLRFELHGIKNSTAVLLDEVEGFAGGFQGEAQLGLIERNITSRRNESPGWDDESIRRRVIRQHTAREIIGLIAVIMELNEVTQARIFRVREDFIDDNISQRTGTE